MSPSRTEPQESWWRSGRPGGVDAGAARNGPPLERDTPFGPWRLNDVGVARVGGKALAHHQAGLRPLVDIVHGCHARGKVEVADHLARKEVELVGGAPHVGARPRHGELGPALLVDGGVASGAYVADIVRLPLGTAKSQLDIVELRLGEPAAFVAADGEPHEHHGRQRRKRLAAEGHPEVFGRRGMSVVGGDDVAGPHQAQPDPWRERRPRRVDARPAGGQPSLECQALLGCRCRQHKRVACVWREALTDHQPRFGPGVDLLDRVHPRLEFEIADHRVPARNEMRRTCPRHQRRRR